ncbi:MAG TPA: class I SAM-dependent methyltransferase [Terracidiphilus sp.]|nr:class I SAM-dependent methyltransferase [Terracidiphilus sp.]
MNPPPDLDSLAGVYRWMEAITFGPFLSRCRNEFLGAMSHCRRALILGDGDGRFTARLLRANPAIEIDAVDTSHAMLQTLVRRAGPHSARVCTHCADVRLWQPSRPPYDLVVTHFLLDFLTEPEVCALAERVSRAVCPSALWIVSEFAIPENSFGRFVARPTVAGLYLGFRWLTGLAVDRLPDHPSALASAGFHLRRSRTRLAGLLVSELWKLDQPEF